jgi:hypothetical protein
MQIESSGRGVFKRSQSIPLIGGEFLAERLRVRCAATPEAAKKIRKQVN